MILVDTVVWIDHLRGTEPHLEEMLDAGNVVMHAMILGELACGNIPKRAEFLQRMQDLPNIRECTHVDVMSMIETNGLMRRGIGFVDAHLLCSVLERAGMTLWTRDRKLKRMAETLGVSYAENA